ncbi:protein kinase [Actinomadura sp. 9N407]|uniref:protein kinase domain-containing protein n=1 Tax=Actinomadura sp. 9N407 TaxID=3375154 RepID=UPI0037B7D460
MINGERVLADRYVLSDRLGSGGMGTVWRAADRLLNRTVAVKEMHLRATGEQLAKHAARAHREAHAIARISHPNVVNIYDLVNENERLWLVMEFVDGPSLKEHVAAAGPMSPSDVAGIGLQLLAALEAVHAAGALHRDIKPGNVLLRPDGRVVLCDFGIAALTGTDSLTATGAVVGSFGYFGPERLTEQPEGPPSDLFSLGVTLCVLLSGRSPFARPSTAGMLHAVVREEPEIPAAAGPLRPVLEALLRKQPADRPSVAETSDVLRSLTTTAPAAYAVPTGAGEIGAVPRRSHRRLVLAALSAVLLLAVVATAGVLATRSGNDGDAAGAVSPPPPSASPGSTGPTGPTPIDAVMPVPDDPDLNAPSGYWLFSGGQYVRARISASGYPVRQGLPAASPLRAWGGAFESLPGFRDRIDATLRVPGSRNEYWVFSGNRYLRMRAPGAGAASGGALVAGPRPLSDWESVFGDLPDDGIDAVMRTPDDPEQYWVFAGDQYVRTSLDGEGPGGSVTYGPSGLGGWAGTLEKFSGSQQGIDDAIPVPGTRNDYWIFFGTQYMKIRVTDVAYDDTVVEGPKLLLDWTALR